MREIDDALARIRYPHPSAPYDDDSGYLDPYDEVDDEPPRLPLALRPALQASFVEAINTALREHGCDNTLRAAEAWAGREKVPWGRLREVLESRGGFCDCEVLYNVVERPY
jgi:hypothetical protein